MRATKDAMALLLLRRHAAVDDRQHLHPLGRWRDPGSTSATRPGHAAHGTAPRRAVDHLGGECVSDGPREQIGAHLPHEEGDAPRSCYV